MFVHTSKFSRNSVQSATGTLLFISKTMFLYAAPSIDTDRTIQLLFNIFSQSIRQITSWMHFWLMASHMQHPCIALFVFVRLNCFVILSLVMWWNWMGTFCFFFAFSSKYAFLVRVYNLFSPMSQRICFYFFSSILLLVDFPFCFFLLSSLNIPLSNTLGNWFLWCWKRLTRTIWQRNFFLLLFKQAVIWHQATPTVFIFSLSLSSSFF